MGWILDLFDRSGLTAESTAKLSDLESQFTVLERENVNLKLETDRLRNQVDAKERENQQLQQENQALRKTRELTHTETSPQWTDYTEDVFHNIIWRWHYKPEIDDTPRDVKPHCPECANPKLLYWTYMPNKYEDGYTLFGCQSHQRRFQAPLQPNRDNDPFWQIKKAIRVKLQDGTWKNAVNQRRER